MFWKPQSKEQKPITKTTRKKNIQIDEKQKKTRKKNIQIDKKQKKNDVMFMKKANAIPHHHQQLDEQKSDQTSTVDDRAECTSFVKLSTSLEFLPEPDSGQPDLATNSRVKKLIPDNLNLKNSNPSEN